MADMASGMSHDPMSFCDWQTTVSRQIGGLCLAKRVWRPRRWTPCSQNALAGLTSDSPILETLVRSAAAKEWLPAEPAWLGGCDDPDDGPHVAKCLDRAYSRLADLGNLGAVGSPASQEGTSQGLQSQ